MSRPARDPSIDWARGVASLIMIQGHAFHGWVSPEAKLGGAYGFTRIFATLPLPAFLVLAGAAVAYRIRAGAARGDTASGVRGALVRRGLQVTLWGYLVSLVYAAMDGGMALETVLRADVLQVIGLSIAGAGLLVGGGGGRVELWSVARRCSVAGVLVTLACPWLSPLGHDLQGPLRFVAAPFVDVPGVTAMPLVPLFAWFSLGTVAGAWLSDPATAAAPAPVRLRRWAAWGGLGLGLALLGHGGTNALLAHLGGELSRAHPAVITNVIEYGGRGLLVLGLAPLLAAALPRGAQQVLTDFGRASLWAYCFHIPFCYGVLGLGLRGQLSTAQALPWVLLLALMSYGVVRARLTHGRRRAPGPGFKLAGA